MSASHQKQSKMLTKQISCHDFVIFITVWILKQYWFINSFRPRDGIWHHRMYCKSPSTVETLYSTIPYTTIFDITRWAHGPQNLQRPIRTLIVLLGFRIKQIFVQFVCLLPVPSTLNEPTCGPLPVTTMTAGLITSDFHTLWPIPLESIIISGVFTKD